MTIRIRNLLFKILTIISLILLLATSALLIYSILAKKFYFPTEHNYIHLQNLLLTKFNYYTVIISIFLFLILSVLNFLYINYQFEKTQSTELIYFALFLIGCLTESFRIFIPCLNLWETSNQVVLIISRIIYFGKILIPLSFIFMAVYSSAEYRQDVERNIIILLLLSAICSVVLPINTNKIFPTCLPQPGYKNLIFTIWIIFILITIFSLIRNDYIANSKTKMPLGFIFLITGYLILCNTMNIVLLVFGTIFMIYGSLTFLQSLHQKYLWD